ncbi:MAG: alcohol dehydrogenase catalytic domain-containing protein [Pseudomonadota bacterium]
MRALVYEGVETLVMRDVPDPVPEAGEELIRVESAGICGSDMHAYLGHDARRPAPLILGHEAAGVIVGGAREGERVTINPLNSCGECQASRNGRENLCPNRQIISMPPREGAFCEYVKIPAKSLVTVPDDVSLDKAALAEPLAVCWHAILLGLDALHPSMDRRAVVLGGGAIGFGSALALAAMGVTDVTIVEPNADRAAFLAEHGATVVPKADGVFPLVVDAVGYAVTRETASALAEPGGVIAHIGLGEDTGGLDIRRMTLQEITFIGTYAYTVQDFLDTTAAIFDGRFGPLDWTVAQPLDTGAAAFAELREGRVAAPKVILRP